MPAATAAASADNTHNNRLQGATMRIRAITTALAMTALALPLALAGCGSEDSANNGGGENGGQSLTLLSGRSKSLIEPLVEKFENQTDIDVQVKYGAGPQLLETLSQAGEYSEADVFWANTAGILGEASNDGLLQKLPDSILDKPGAFVPSSGYWTPVTARFRVLAYNPENVDAADLPDSVLDLPQLGQVEGPVGWTPSYTSFQDFVTALRLTEGRSTASDWLSRMKQLDPQPYQSNTPMVQALARGDLDIALTNHYYIHRLKHGGAEGEYEGHEEEEGEEEEEHQPRPDAPVAIHHFEAGDPGNLALVTGAGLLKNAPQPEAAKRFITFLLSQEAQQFAANQVNEYPVTADVTLPDHLMPMDRVLELSPQFDFERLKAELEPTLQLLREQELF
jgi:iron(III) transport system substrate-binding protein